MAEFKVTQAQENLTQSRDLYDKAYECEDKNNKRMAELLGQLAMLNMDKIEFDEIITALVNVIGVMSEMRDNWCKLAQFFQCMANLVHVGMNQTLKHFLDYVHDDEVLNVGDCISMGGPMKDLLYSTTLEAVNIAALINNISSTYVTVSHKHIMPKIASLDKFMALDGERDQAQINKLQTQLLEDCKEAENTIESLAKQRHQEFDQYFQKRKMTIQNELESILPPVPAGIQGAVHEGVKEKAALPPPRVHQYEFEDFI